MRATDKDYERLLTEPAPAGLCPPGPAQAGDRNVLAAAAPGLRRAHNRMLDLLDEADPRTARELLADWERVCGLPDACSAELATTLQERRAAVVGRLTATGGQSVAYFQGLAARLGYSVSIDEFRPFIAGWSRCGDALNGPASVRHSWRVRVHGPRLTLFRAGASAAGDRLGKIAEAEDLECLFKRLKPAHTTLVFAYEGA